MKLHYASASPFVRKVMAAALELGFGDRIEKIDTVPVPTDTNMALAGDNPLAKIPTLITDEGETLYDSRVITAYLNDLAARDGRPGLLPQEGAARWRVLRHEALCDGMLDAAVITRYELALRPQEKHWHDWMDAQLSRVTRGLDYLNATLDDWQGPGDTPGLAPIAAGCVCGYLDFRFEDLAWRNGRDALATWFEGFSQRPSMASTAPKV